jgi:glycosyltransferase involved in cell wall biosynthesis
MAGIEILIDGAGYRAGESFDPAAPDYANTPASARRPLFGYQPADSLAAPVVTIVTPYFNPGQVFRETALSVFRQSLQQWEWIIIDDGSTDPASLALLEVYGQFDPRIHVLRQDRNRGPSAARNRGFKEARSELVFMLDADDLIEPTTLEKMAWYLATHPEAAFVTGYNVGFGSMEYLWRRGFDDGAAFLQENLSTVTKMVRRSVHQAVGGYDETVSAGLEDWEFWLRAAANDHWGGTIKEFFDWYRRRTTGREHWQNVTDVRKTAAFREQMHQRYPQLLERFPTLPRTGPGLSWSGREAPFQNRLTRSGKPRLLFLVPHFELGGADKFNLDLIRQLQRAEGYEVTVVATEGGAQAWRHLFEGLTPDVFVMDEFLALSNSQDFLRYLVASRCPDAILVSHSRMGYELSAFLRAFAPEVPVVDYLHMEEERWAGGGFPGISLGYASQLARTLVSSEHLRRWLVERGGDPARIDLCTTNVDTQLWRRRAEEADDAASRWNVDRSHPVILWAGRICEQKQPHLLVEVLARVAKAFPSFTALLAGDGEDRAALEAQLARAKLPQVRLLGAVPNDSMRGLLALADVFFLPSRWEGISLALYEAMAMEATPLASEVGGQAELVTPNCGVLVKPGPGEVEAYTAALLRMLREPKWRAGLARAGRARVEKSFGIEALGKVAHRSLMLARKDAAQHPEDLSSRPVAVLLAGLATRATMMQREADRLRDLVTTELQRTHDALQVEAAGVLGELLRAQLEAGSVLLEAGLRAQGLRAFDAAVHSADASKRPSLSLEARTALVQALTLTDPVHAAAVLTETLPLLEQLKGRPTRDAAEAVVKRLKAMPSPLPQGPRSAPAPGTEPQPGAPTVTVVIPCYKQAHYLPEAVQSVVAQTRTDWEVVIVNDGSPDDTSAIARRLMADLPGRAIRLVEQDNRGLPAARNAGFQAARGRYVLPLDADDKIKPTMLERLVSVLDSYPKVGFAYTEIEHFGSRSDVFPLPDFDRNVLLGQDNIACVCSLVRRSAWEQTGGYNETMREGYEDWDFWVTLAGAGWDGHCVHQPLFLYRKAGESMLTESNKIRPRLIARIILNHPKIYTAASLEEARRLLSAPGEQPVPAPEAGSGAAAWQPLVAPRPARRPPTRDAGPAVSIVMPSYGQAEFLPMAVGSVALQSFKDWELIIVDDGSQDDTAAVARQLFANLPGRRCRLLQQPNAGVAAARNGGLAAARGRYVLPLDADDAIDATYLERAVALLEREDVDIVGTDGVMFGTRSDHMRMQPRQLWSNVQNANCLNYCSLYHRDVWERVGGYNSNLTKGYEDWDFWVGCRAAGFTVGHVAEPVFFYRTKEVSRDVGAVRHHDKQLRARIALNHPTLYPPRVLDEARALLDREPLPAHGTAE